MWIDSEFKIGKDSHSGRVNTSGNLIEIELPYFKNWIDCLGQKIEYNKKSFSINNMKDVGDRHEVILIVLNKGEKNEHKHDESRKNSDNRK